MKFECSSVGLGQRDLQIFKFWFGDKLSGVVSGTTVRALLPGRFGQKNENNRFRRYGQRTNKNVSNNKGGLVLWDADVCYRAAFAQPGPVSSISLGRFFSVTVKRS